MLRTALSTIPGSRRPVRDAQMPSPAPMTRGLVATPFAMCRTSGLPPRYISRAMTDRMLISGTMTEDRIL